jgi:hypothetical protein
MSTPNTKFIGNDVATNYELVGLSRGLPLAEVLRRGFTNDPLRFTQIMDWCNKACNSKIIQNDPVFQRYSIGELSVEATIGVRTALANGNLRLTLTDPSYKAYTVDDVVAVNPTSPVHGRVVSTTAGEIVIQPYTVPSFTVNDFVNGSSALLLKRGLDISDPRQSLQPNIVPTSEYNYPSFMDSMKGWHYNETTSIMKPIDWIGEGENPLWSSPFIGEAALKLAFAELANALYSRVIPFDRNTDRSSSKGIIQSIKEDGGFSKDNGTPVLRSDYETAWAEIRRNGGFGNVVMFMGSYAR